VARSVAVSDQEVTLEGTTMTVNRDGEPFTFFAPAVHPNLEGLLVRRLQSVDDAEEAASLWRADAEAFVVTRPLGNPRATLLVDPEVNPTGDHLVAWGRQLARLRSGNTSTVMVCGGVSIDQDSDYDTLGGLAAALIRLRLGLFIGVAQRAKALATQVGMEGSWDGESVWAEDESRAYDYLCDQVRESDVVVLVGLDPQERSRLIQRWGGVS
jgi:UDP-N-acetylmuramoyl-tripeptide--D-alanyl-D-alanine ligase